MSLCQVCSIKINDRTESSIQCTKEECKKWSHSSCAQIQIKDLKKNKTSYICKPCCKTLTSKSTLTGGISAMGKDNVGSGATSDSQKLNDILSRLNKLDTIDKKVDNLAKLTGRVAALEETTKKHSDEIKRLNQAYEEIADLRKRLEGSQTYLRANNLIINGIPDGEDGPDVYDAVINLAGRLGVTIDKQHIDNAHRVPTRNSATSLPIVVKFKLHWVRESIYKAKQKRENWNLTTNDLGYNGAAIKVHISEHHSPETQKLLYLARQAKKEKGYNKAWAVAGQVYIKKTKEEEKILVTNELALQAI